MNGNKWVAAAIITVVILVLVAILLGMILVFKMAQAWGGRESDISLGDIFEPQQAVEEPPMEQQEAAAINPVTVEGTVGILVADEGDMHMRMLDQFFRTCEELGVPCNTYTGSGEPKELLEAGLDMLANGVSGLAITSIDPELTAVLVAEGEALGVPVITINAGWNVPHSGNEALHISQWGSVEEIGINLLLMAADRTGRKCDVVVLTPGGPDPITEVMDMAQKEWPELEKINVVDVLSAEGDLDRCQDMIFEAVEAYNPDALICVDYMTMEVATRVMVEMGMEIPVVGYATPYELAPYSNAAAVAMHSDPRATGELAARSLIGLLAGEVELRPGDAITISNGTVYNVELQEGVPHMHVDPMVTDMYNAEENAEWYE